VLLLDKPAGLTSNQALQRVKRLLRAQKGGHTGSLDPAATGMLPLCFGEATKICAYMLDADKTYRVTARLGEATDTGDGDGKIVATAAVPVLTAADWESIFRRFTGAIRQVPPMYSALKVGGKRLYELARKGQSVEREPRTVQVRQLSLLEPGGSRLVFRVRCSKGTYVRTLVEDMATAAGTVAYTAALHREAVGDFREQDMLGLRGAERIAEEGPDVLQARLLPADKALPSWPTCRLATDQASRFAAGQAVATEKDASGRVRVYDEDDNFIGIGEQLQDGRLSPRRISRRGA
jgi:tRNA pseudouridine55 synthase